MPEPEPEPEPTVYYTVTLPFVEGAVTDPVAGDYDVESWSTFRFYLTLDTAYSQSQPVVTTSRGETLQPRTSDGAYLLKYVRTDVEVYIDGILLNPPPVANEPIRAAAPEPEIWSEDACLCIRLPEGLRLFASYVMAHALYLRGEYGRSLGMAENALIMKQGSYPISELFLHLSASMACMSLKDVDAAKAHFGAAWDIARPDGLIELIGEHHGLLQGLIEACLKSQYPDDFARIIEITYRFSYGWRRIHNPDSGEDVADDLTTTEFTMAMLACRGWTNAEIARHMGVSPGTVKNRLSGVYAKLGIGTRAELVAHMLR